MKAIKGYCVISISRNRTTCYDLITVGTKDGQPRDSFSLTKAARIAESMNQSFGAMRTGGIAAAIIEDHRPLAERNKQ